MGGCVQHGNCGGFDSLHRKGPCRDQRAGCLTSWRELPVAAFLPRHAMSSPGAGPLCRASCPPSAHLKCKQLLQGDILREGYLQIYFCVQTLSPGIVRRDDGMQPWSRRTCTERWCTLQLWPCHFSFPPDCLPPGISWSTPGGISIRAWRGFSGILSLGFASVSRQQGLLHSVPRSQMQKNAQVAR